MTLTGEDLSKDEHVDNEFLWNMKLLSEVSTLNYTSMSIMSIMSVMSAVL